MASFYLATTLYTSRARRSKVDNCEMVDQYLTALKELYCTGPDTIDYLYYVTGIGIRLRTAVTMFVVVPFFWVQRFRDVR